MIRYKYCPECGAREIRDTVRLCEICETCEKYESKLDFLRAEIEVLRGVGCRGEKADEPESGPCGVCLLCAEERGAKLAIDAVRSGDFDVFRGEAWATAEAICARDRGRR